MSDTAKNRILSAARAALENQPPETRAPAEITPSTRSQAECIEALTQKLEAVRAEVHIVSQSEWGAAFLETARSKPVKSLLYAEPTEISDDISGTWKKSRETGIELLAYDQELEPFKERLFEVDAAITTAAGAVAENGALILWPDAVEPRAMSLVPPIHFAVLKASTITASFNEAITAGQWNERMPTNLVMVSGPSRTADIELILAFGVHGPKELVVFILDDC